MRQRTRISGFTLALSLAAFSATVIAPVHINPQDDSATQKPGKQKDNDRDVRENAALWAQIKNPVLWHQPKNISSLDLFYGQGGTSHQPKAPYTFVSEDTNGTNPKLDVRDANGKKWRVKEGEEARPEVVASRLLWAVGYYANDDYLVQMATVNGIKMKRGSKELKAGQIINCRFSRKPGGQDKIGIWDWKTNPFYGKREFNGLRVMMAVMNNWDLKDVNNSVYTDSKTGQQIFLVNDIGASFGTNGLSWTKARSKGNIDSFRNSGFVQSTAATTVSFSTPKKPTGMLLATAGATAKSYSMRSGLDWIGNDIPREDARWMGSLLGQLTHKQLEDAFSAGNFPREDVDAYVEVVESRIAELKKL